MLNCHPKASLSSYNTVKTKGLRVCPRHRNVRPRMNPWKRTREGAEGSGEDLTNPSPPMGVSEDLPVSPSDDFRSYTNIVWKMTARLGISTAQPSPEVDDVIFEVVHVNLSSTVAIPLSKMMLQSFRSIWGKPVSVPISSKKLDHLYRTQEASAEFLFKHPQPNSVVVSSASKSRRHHSTPPTGRAKNSTPMADGSTLRGLLG